MLKVRINKGEHDSASQAVDEDAHEYAASEFMGTEADELNDKVDEL